MDVGPTELVIILIIVIILFGVGRIGQLGGELGRAIREFRAGLEGDHSAPTPPDTTGAGQPEAEPHHQPEAKP